MMFRLGVNVTSVSTSLCAIPESQIPEITGVVQNQIDVAAIIRVVSTIHVDRSMYIPYTYISPPINKVWFTFAMVAICLAVLTIFSCDSKRLGI